MGGSGGGEEGASFLYETLIPFLNSRPLMANAKPEDGGWQPLPTAAAAGEPDDAAAPSLVTLEAARRVLVCSGMPQAHATQLVLLARWTLVRMAVSDLRAVETVAPSDVALL